MGEPTGDRSVVVTGCSSGIGRATVERLSAGGFSVIAGVRTDEDAAKWRQAGESVIPVIMDVSDPESVSMAVAKIGEEFPDGVDGLVNNAGVAVAGPLELVAMESWHRQFDVNVLGTVRLTQSLLPLLRRRCGRVVNIGSAASRLALPLVGPYASSKYAVEGLTDSLRREVASSGVKVILVSPGQTKTPIFDKSEEEAEERLDSAFETIDHDYRPALTRLRQRMRDTERSRRSPDRVAAVVSKALSVRRPRKRYYVGWDAKGAALVDRFVPTAFVDWVIARQLDP